jgi:phage terminase large subunit-like protein
LRYEKGEVFHVGTLERLEDQLVTWSPLLSDVSPDRLDALVWAVTAIDEGVGAHQKSSPSERRGTYSLQR